MKKRKIVALIDTVLTWLVVALLFSSLALIVFLITNDKIVYILSWIPCGAVISIFVLVAIQIKIGKGVR